MRAVSFSGPGGNEVIDSSGNTQTMKFLSVELDKPAPADTFAIDRKAFAGWSFIKP